MSRHIRMGLIVGVISIFVTGAMSILVGICGPLMTALLGGLAGFLAVRSEPRPLRNIAARNGAIAGGITGGLAIIGQIIGAIGALMFIQSTGTIPFGTLPSDDASSAVFYAAGIGSGLCFGVIGACLGAGAGALAAYLSGSQETAAPLPPAPLA